MNRVYAVCIENHDDGEIEFTFELFSTREKAQKYLKQLADAELENWVNDRKDELESYEYTDNSFDVSYYDTQISIWIQPKDLM